jgi:F-type H+-transporting ATPase subunit a
MTARPSLSSSIEIGNHPEWHLGGWTFNADTIWTTVVAGVIVVALGLWARKQLTKETEDHVPTKLQLIWETIIGQVTREVEGNLGRVNPTVVTYAVALFFFILVANWLELIPSEPNDHLHLLPAPTSDTNLTYAMAVLVIGGVWTYGVRQKGLRGYLKHFLEPYPILLPLNVLEELIKPVTLALRLFGNIFAGSIMLALIGGLITWKVGGIPVGGVVGGIFNVVWKLFDMFIGAIQAFIFALLTVLYFGMAGAGHGDEAHASSDAEHDSGQQPREPTERERELSTESKEAAPVAH